MLRFLYLLGVFKKEIFDSVKVEHIIPVVIYLVHESCESNGNVFEVGGGWVAQVRWQRAQGAGLNYPVSVETLQRNWAKVIDFTDGEYPESANDSVSKMFENYNREDQGQLAGNKTGKTELHSPQIFDLIGNYLARGEGGNAIKVCQATYNFDITKTKKGKPFKTWGVDLKNGNGAVGKPFDKPDATFRFTDSDFYDVCMGKLNPQIAFLQGKMKIKGNMKKATVFTPELFPKPTPENFAKYASPKL